MSGWWKPLSFTEGRAAQGDRSNFPQHMAHGFVHNKAAQFFANGLLQSLLARAGV